jgi:2-keto-4-pentenoate hydratase/2-oxohepta-3-ene-1,7-dioic acid hydratase in catechol pathway
MKLATYLYDNSISCGILTEKGIIDIPHHTKEKIRYHSVKEILIRGDACMAEVAQLVNAPKKYISPEEVKILPPIPRPGKLLALAGNYTKHLEEYHGEKELADSPHETTTPRLFLMPSTAVTATDTRIPWPCYSDQVDYEVELAVFIGKAVRCAPPEEALDYVAGYSIANDISARSVTFKSGRAKRPWDEFYDWLCGKWSDGFLPLGPCLVTTDELIDPQNLDMELKVNGQVRQKANTSDMIFSVAEIVSFISHIMTLEPGDCIATGTPEGVGAATGQFLQAGDRIECKIEKIGILANTIGEPPAPLYKPLEK